MDQIKIGKFIAEIRKEKNLTQLELATRLGITDRAISKWENGRGLPDLSLLKPLCDELEISVNDLLNGERVECGKLNIIAEENIINTLEFSKNKIKKVKVLLISVFLSVLLFVVILFTCFGIDIFRMKNNLPVMFGTWGYSYTPYINIRDDLMERAIREYIVAYDDAAPKHNQGEKAFVALRTYLFEEIEKETKFNFFTWVVGGKYYLENGEMKNSSSYSIPHMFVVEKQGDEYVIVDSRVPRDGGYYSEDMKNIFPSSVRRDMNNFYSDGTSERLQTEIEEKAKLFFHID